MNLIRSFRLSRDHTVTVANLIDELLQLNGDREVSIEDCGPFHLAELHAQVCVMDAFLRRIVELKPGQPVAIYRTNTTACFHWFLAVIRAGGIAVPLTPMLSLGEVRRILANSGTEILITDRAVFERQIVTREALEVRTWIQSDSDDDTTTLDGFLRVTDTGAPFPPTAIDPGATIAVGAPGRNGGTGAVYLWKRQGGQWRLDSELKGFQKQIDFRY